MFIKMKKYVRGKIISSPDKYPKYMKYGLRDELLKVPSESMITDMKGIIEPILIRSKIAVINVANVIDASCNFLFDEKLFHKLFKELIKLSAFFLFVDILL
tara:strand:- start:15859 stop:16161 length:303 start_codon:yes stop_codon:yes gene_type:complete